MADHYTHRNLVLWRRAQELAHQVMLLIAQIPNTWSNVVIVRQIIGAVTSVGTNIAEGHGRYTPASHRYHLLVARGSLAETDSWLDLLRRSNLIAVADEQRLVAECREIAAMLTSKIRMLERIAKSSSDDEAKLQEQREDYQIEVLLDKAVYPFTEEDYLIEQ